MEVPSQHPHSEFNTEKSFVEFTADSNSGVFEQLKKLGIRFEEVGENTFRAMDSVFSPEQITKMVESWTDVKNIVTIDPASTLNDIFKDTPVNIPDVNVDTTTIEDVFKKGEYTIGTGNDAIGVSLTDTGITITKNGKDVTSSMGSFNAALQDGVFSLQEKVQLIAEALGNAGASVIDIILSLLGGKNLLMIPIIL